MEWGLCSKAEDHRDWGEWSRLNFYRKKWSAIPSRLSVFVARLELLQLSITPTYALSTTLARSGMALSSSAGIPSMAQNA